MAGNMLTGVKYPVGAQILGQMVVQLVEALCLKMEGPTFDSRWAPWKFASALICLSAFSSPGVQSMGQTQPPT